MTNTNQKQLGNLELIPQYINFKLENYSSFLFINKDNNVALGFYNISYEKMIDVVKNMLSYDFVKIKINGKVHEAKTKKEAIKLFKNKIQELKEFYIEVQGKQ
ncbi:hypothetical protein CSB11_02290 [Candidatus Campbellbacteria bacterium]|nr:MAG: hypothetical protein CSB11_02290 [Candidatus Campbellbacteria bacterium]